MKIYVLRYGGKYVSDFGHPNPELTTNVNKAAVWFTKGEIKANARENGFRLGKKYEIVECKLVAS